MAKTNDIARLIVDEFEAIEDYRLKDHARIVAKIERTVRGHAGEERVMRLLPFAPGRTQIQPKTKTMGN